MGETVVSVTGLGKRYMIGGPREQYGMLRDVIVNAVKQPIARIRHPGAATSRSDELWALRDVSLGVEAGEVVGIVGRNGAGKTTLLKVLSRITEPTTGRVELRGRVGSLLEVGTGFHPELTGRENVYLNGAILGMTKAEIGRKFDAIVSFSELGRFLDTPVKRYSSGMYVRLAFAVASNLEPDILVVDEVLSVGDAEFQRKCLGRMDEVAHEGRTVLFVSHNMGAVSRLCSRGVLLEAGRVVADGPTDEVITEYLRRGAPDAGVMSWPTFDSAPGKKDVKLRAVRVISNGEATQDVDIDKPVAIEVDYWNRRPGACVWCSVHVLDRMGVAVFASTNRPAASTRDDGISGRPHEPGLYRTVCTIPGEFLNEGLYKVNALLLSDLNWVEAQEEWVVSFTVHDNGVMRDGFTGTWIGVVRPRLDWHTERVADLEEALVDAGQP